MAQTSRRIFSDAKIATVLKFADKTTPVEAAQHFKINVKNIYNWRARTGSQTHAAPKTNGAASKPVQTKTRGKRFADGQKRLILRAAKDTSVAAAATRFGVGKSTIAEWRKRGYRASPKKSRTPRRDATRKPSNGHRQPSAGAKQVPSLASLQTIGHLRDEIAKLLDENQRLSAIVVKQVMELHSAN